MNSASLCSLAGRYDNPIPPRFLAPIDFLKIPALYSVVKILTRVTPESIVLDTDGPDTTHFHSFGHICQPQCKTLYISRGLYITRESPTRGQSTVQHYSF